MFVEDIYLALNKPAWQISTSGNGVASRTVDGNLNANFFGDSCTHTRNGLIKPWLTVHLEHRYLIQKVKISNRARPAGMSFYIMWKISK